MKEKIQKTLLTIFVFTVLCFFISCVSANYGSIIPDAAVTKDFEAFQINPDMNYYYSGADTHPNAIMGLKKNYALDSGIWKPIEAQPKVLKEMVTGMKTKVLVAGTSQHGFIMKDDKGQQIGVWYSMLGVNTVIKTGKDNTVMVYPPALNTPDGVIYKEEIGGGAGER